jgi:predicted ATPase
MAKGVTHLDRMILEIFELLKHIVALPIRQKVYYIQINNDKFHTFINRVFLFEYVFSFWNIDQK